MTNPKGGFCRSEQDKKDDNPNCVGYICHSERQYPTKCRKNIQQRSTDPKKSSQKQGEYFIQVALACIGELPTVLLFTQ